MNELYLCFQYASNCKICPNNRRCEKEYKQNMKKSCKYCGRIVDEDHICRYKPKYDKEDTEQRRFRNTQAWAKKSREIKQRDKYLCVVCMANLYNTITQLNYKSLEVHHIIPIKVDASKRLSNDNLITLCHYHHRLAEQGEIPAEELQRLISK